MLFYIDTQSFKEDSVGNLYRCLWLFLQVENLHRNKQPFNICKYNCPREKDNREEEDAIQNYDY